MDKERFQTLLTDEVNTYKQLFETVNNDWIIKGFIDIDKNIYSITNDTKVVSKIIEITLIPRLKAFAQRHNLVIELPSAQNFYPDLTFRDSEGNLFALDFKSSYYKNGKVNGLTLGSYWGYFRNRSSKKNMDYPYEAYKCHLVLGILYKQSPNCTDDIQTYHIDDIETIKSVIQDFILFVQPKWKIASDRPGSGNTRNIGGVTEINRLISGSGTFAELGEDIFDHYWMNFYNAVDARTAQIGNPRYNNIESYQEYLSKEQIILNKLKKR